MVTGKKPVKLVLDPSTTIKEAQDKIKTLVRGPGVHCPVCRQLVKIVEKDLSPEMAYVLILLYRHFKESDDWDWLDIAQYLESMVAIGSEVTGGEWRKLEYWGLILERPPVKRSVLSKEPPVKTVGFYRLTDRGKGFLLGQLKVPKSVLLYQGNILEFSGKTVSIQECLGKDYIYEDLLAGKLGAFAV